MVVCPSGQTDCSGVCTDTSSDPSNCGACGVTRQPSQVCKDGHPTYTKNYSGTRVPLGQSSSADASQAGGCSMASGGDANGLFAVAMAALGAALAKRRRR